MVGRSRSSAGPGARVHGAVQRVQHGPLRHAVGARREARAPSAGGAPHRERGADAGERGAAAPGQTSNERNPNQPDAASRTSVDSPYQATAVGPVVFSLMTSGPSKTFGVAVADRGSK